jgi:nitroreductase
MNIIETMNKRKAVRKYSQDPLPRSILGEITDAASSIEGLYSDIDVKVHIIENGRKVWLDDDLRPVYPCTERENQIIRELKALENNAK